MFVFCRIIVFLILFLSYSGLQAMNFGSSLSSFTSTMEGIGSTAKQMAYGMAESFGMDPPGYNYTFRFANNSNSIGECEARRIKQYQGLMIKRGSIESHTLGPAEISSVSEFNDIGLYLEVILRCDGNDLYTNNIINLLPSYKQNNETYFYNIFENADGPAAESLGIGKTTSKNFLASIFNRTHEIQKVTFPYGNKLFTVQLDSESSNTLMSPSALQTTTKYPIRPTSDSAVLDFGKAGQIIIQPEGLATGEKGKDGKWTNVQPMNYHYEIVYPVVGDEQDLTSCKVITRGFVPGNFSRETKGRIRNITPVECLVWNKSAEQVGDAEPSYAYIDDKSRSVWVAYSFSNFTIKDASGNVLYNGQEPIIMQVPSGQAVQLFFMRPSLDVETKLTQQDLLQMQNLEPVKKFHELQTESILGKPASDFVVNVYETIKTLAPETPKASLYIVSINTNDPQDAKRFLKNLMAGSIAIPETPSLTSPQFTQEMQNQLLTEKLTVDLGVLKDQDTGLNGYLLCYDVFTPYSGENPGPYYYSVKPPLAFLKLSKMALDTYLNQSALTGTGNLSTINNLIENWAQELWGAATKKQGIVNVREKVTTYLKENGRDGLFDVTKGKLDKTKYSWMWNMGLNDIIVGPRGLANIPFQWAAGKNHYPFSGTSVPTITNPQTGTQENDWAPTKTIGIDGKEVAL